MELKRSILEIDNERIVCESLVRKDNVVILHGAGASNRKRYYALARAITRRGYGVILFDFSGHGDSTGELRHLSLARRLLQARGVVDAIVPKESKLYLIGFSMSGQTICDLLPAYGERVQAILLGCPGIYTQSAQAMAFGGGEFTTKIRVADSWKDSVAFSELSDFEGKAVIVIGEHDQVIPGEVVTSLKLAAKHPTYIEYPDVDHQLAVWLAAHSDEQEKLLDVLFDEN